MDKYIIAEEAYNKGKAAGVAITSAINEKEFAEGVDRLREFAAWELRAYDAGFDTTSVGAIVELLTHYEKMLCKGNEDWAFDPVDEINWLMEYCYKADELEGWFMFRGKSLYLNNGQALYRFLDLMNETNWGRDNEENNSKSDNG